MSGHSGFPAESPQAKQAAGFRASHPLSDADPHMHDWNGGISREQLRSATAKPPCLPSLSVTWRASDSTSPTDRSTVVAICCSSRARRWLEQQLARAAADGKRCMVAAHHQVCPGIPPKPVAACTVSTTLIADLLTVSGGAHVRTVAHGAVQAQRGRLTWPGTGARSWRRWSRRRRSRCSSAVTITSAATVPSGGVCISSHWKHCWKVRPDRCAAAHANAMHTSVNQTQLPSVRSTPSQVSCSPAGPTTQPKAAA